MDIDRPGQHTVTGWPRSARPAHAVRTRRPPAGKLTAATVALLLVGIGVAAASCLRSLDTRSTPTSASLITVAPTVGAAVPEKSAVSPTTQLP